MPAIQCNQGDLYQEYMGEASAPTNIAPDFASLKPVLSFILTSSRVAEGLVVPSSMKWYFNDVEIKFSGNVSTNTFGTFQVYPLPARYDGLLRIADRQESGQGERSGLLYHQG